MLNNVVETGTTVESAQEARFVIFQLGREKFGARIERVREVLVVEHVTPIPRAPDYVLGVINLRGLVTSIIDLRHRLSIRQIEELGEVDNRTVVVVEIGNSAIGMAVDDVESITPISFDDIESSLDMISKDLHTPFLQGVAKVGSDLIILLNLEIVFSEFEVEKLAELTGEREVGATLEDEFFVSKEQLELLDLSHDDIDTISTSTITTESTKDEIKEVIEVPKEVEVQKETTKATTPPSKEPKAAPKPKAKTEKPKITKADLEKKTKAELVKMATKVGIKNANSQKKAQLVKRLSQS